MKRPQHYTLTNINQQLSKIVNDYYLVYYSLGAGEMEAVYALRSTEYLKYEREYLPWYVMLTGPLNFYLDMFFGKPAYDKLEVGCVLLHL